MGRVTDLFRMYTGDTVRLGIGERVDSEKLLATLRARDAFIRAFQEHAPEAIDELWSPVTHELYQRHETRLLAIIRERRDGGISWEEAFTDPEMSPFVTAIDLWAVKWNVRTDWMHLAMSGWFMDTYLPDDPPERELYGLSGFVLRSSGLAAILSAPAPHFSFADKEYPDHGDPTSWPLDPFPEDPGTGDRYGLEFDWNPAIEGRKANLDRAVAQFLHYYRAAQDRRLEEAEERYPAKAQTRLYDHFVWLVQFQVLEWSYSKVAREANRSRPAVTEAIRDTAALIDLPLREA